MEQVIWIEQLSRQHDVLSRHRLEGQVLYIGRGYDNDVILDDPFVASRHIRIERDADGTLHAVDLQTVNGLYLGNSRKRQERIKLEGDKPIRIGRTYLRIRGPSFSVTPERHISLHSSAWPSLLLWMVALYAFNFLIEWLGVTKEVRLLDFARSLFILTIVLLIWTVFWAILSRIFSGAAHFDRHLKIAIILFLILDLYNDVAHMAAFSLSSTAFIQYNYIGLSLLLGAFIILHLRLIGSGHMVWKAGVVSVLIFTGIALAASRDPTIYNNYDYVYFQQPPSFRLVSPQPEKAFFADVSRLKDKLDAARKEEPPRSSSFFSD